MSRWVAKRMTALRAWTREQGDTGQTSFEYLGIAVVVVVIIVAIVASGIGGIVAGYIIDKIDAIAGAG
ncbi:hypothetical protein [Streptomyces sp. NBC_01262]|uniref:hypothetical protein n=1 Tax=Streptomyces sp. NBC_01262 TaxID=2903803 RepID=UPI002E374369|nr:hypothetical protein [Streptomyces sp. NBC_01262]